MVSRTYDASIALWRALAADLSAMVRRADRPEPDFLACGPMPEHLLCATDPDLQCGLHAFREHVRAGQHGRILEIDAELDPGFATVTWSEAGRLAYASGRATPQVARALFEAAAKNKGR